MPSPLPECHQKSCHDGKLLFSSDWEHISVLDGEEDSTSMRQYGNTFFPDED